MSVRNGQRAARVADVELDRGSRERFRCFVAVGWLRPQPAHTPGGAWSDNLELGSRAGLSFHSRWRWVGPRVAEDLADHGRTRSLAVGRPKSATGLLARRRSRGAPDWLDSKPDPSRGSPDWPDLGRQPRGDAPGHVAPGSQLPSSSCAPQIASERRGGVPPTSVPEPEVEVLYPHRFPMIQGVLSR
jgi:hypothetical protein